MRTYARGHSLLSDAKVRQSSGPARLHDGGGLYVEIDERRNKRWVLRLTIGGKRTRRGLGSYPVVSLAKAREKADELRRSIAAGDDLRNKDDDGADLLRKRSDVSFQDYFCRHFREVIAPELNPKFAGSYFRSVEQHLFPAIGHRPISEVRTKEVIEALRLIWQTTPDRARRVLQRASVAFESAITHEVRELADPTRGVRRELGRSRRRVVHRPSLPWQEAPAFLSWLQSRPRVTPSCRLALAMIIVTGLRSEEVRLAKWGEFNLEAQEWRVPGYDDAESRRLGYSGYRKKRMKTGLDHIVPLSSAAREVLSEARKHASGTSGDALVFPSALQTPLSDNALSKLLRESPYAGRATPHGFRATLKTWCAEQEVRDEVSECLLAHGDPDLVRRAYRRATYLDERRGVLERWSTYLLRS